MKTILRLFLIAFVGGGWTLAASELHVVRLSDDNYWIGIIPKSRLGFTDTYVDVRTWSDADVAGHADFVKRVTEAGKEKWLTNIAPPESQSLVDHLLGLLKNASSPTDSSHAKDATEKSEETPHTSDKPAEKQPLAPIYRGVR